MASYLFLKFQCFILLLLWLQLASTTEIPITASSSIAKPGCRDKCGNISIPYPFGMGDGCFLNKYFNITCNESLPKPAAYRSVFNISNISISDGEMTVEQPIATDCSGVGIDIYNRFSKFTFSHTKNKFFAIGCNTYAYLEINGNASTATGCMSICNTVGDTTNGSCTGIGCCQAGSIPAGVKVFNVTVGSLNVSRRLDFNPCSYAFLAEESSFNFSSSYLKDFKTRGSGMVPVVADWTIGNETCQEAQRNLTTYACGRNTDCIHGKGPGYRCSCKPGYTGINPYLDCQDIDECNLQKNPCTHGSYCINTEGSYQCPCIKGYTSEFRDGNMTCIPIPESIFRNRIFVGTCLSLSVLLLSLVTSIWLYWGYRKRKHLKVKEEFFKQNGGLILSRLLNERQEDVETSRNGRGGKKKAGQLLLATIYTESELSKATNNYHENQILGRGGFGTVYKGTLANGDVVAIKKTKIVDRNQNEQFMNEIAVLSQINHKNVVQLLGCCLESEVTLLVYEFISNGTLHQHLHEYSENQTAGSATLSWENRLRIASEVAGSLAYLHAEASIPIIHRDVKSSNVLLDDDYKAKVSDFGASRLNPTDQAQLSTVVQGTFGYLDPEYMLSNQLTEKSDVYSFGVLLVELLTGKAVFSPDRLEEERNLANYFLSSLRTNRLFAILDGNLVRYDDNERISSVDVHQQIQETAELAQKCLRMKGEKRPTMKEVAMVLHGLMRSSSSYPGGRMDDEELPNNSKEEFMLLLESANLSYTDSMTTIGDSSKGTLALETEGR